MFATVTTQIKELWSRLSVAQRAMLSCAAAAVVALVMGTFYWATLPDYVVLASNLTPQSAAETVGLLESKGIEFELSFSGSVVSVPRSNLAKARIALKDVLEPEMADSSSGFGAFPGSPAEEDVKRTRELEERIARSIERIRGVRSATIHISKEPSSPFVSEQKPTTASVILDINSSTPWSGSTAQSVLTMVARAVEGLSPENITLMDTNGRMFEAASGVNGHMSAQFEHRQMIEHALASKAETMLAELLGPGKAVVRVTAEVDFKETTRTETTYDPDGKVKIQETIETISQTGGTPLAGDVGATPNLVPDLTNGDAGATYKKEINSTDYDNATINQTVVDSPGTIIRLTVAAIVDLSPPPVDPDAPIDANADANAAPLAQLAKTDVEAIIRQAVGYNEDRNDALQVLFAPMRPIPSNVVPPSFVSTVTEYEELIDKAILGLGVMLAAILGFLALKKMKPVVVSSERTAGLSPEQLTSILELSEKVKGSPDAAAQILSLWMGDEESDEATKAAAASQQRKAA